MRSKGIAVWGGFCLLGFLAGCACCGKAEVKPEMKNDEPLPMPACGPPPTACWAVPNDLGHSIGYLVGGGSAWHGDGPTRDEGTWGWDYDGCLLPSRVMLDWFHCKYQGGDGAYSTDGPRPLEAVERRHDE